MDVGAGYYIFEPDSTAAQYASEYSSFSNKPVKIMEDVAFGAMEKRSITVLS